MDLDGGLADQPAEAGGEVALEGVRERVVQALPAAARESVGQDAVGVEPSPQGPPHVIGRGRPVLAGVGPRCGVVGVAGVVGGGGAQDGPEALAALEVQVAAQVPALPVRQLGEGESAAFVALRGAVFQQARQDRDDDLVQRPREGSGRDGLGEPQQRLFEPVGLRALQRQERLCSVDDELQARVGVVQALQLAADQRGDVPHDGVQHQVAWQAVDEPVGPVQVRTALPQRPRGLAGRGQADAPVLHGGVQDREGAQPVGEQRIPWVAVGAVLPHPCLHAPCADELGQAAGVHVGQAGQVVHPQLLLGLQQRLRIGQGLGRVDLRRPHGDDPLDRAQQVRDHRARRGQRPGLDRTQPRHARSRPRHGHLSRWAGRRRVSRGRFSWFGHVSRVAARRTRSVAAARAPGARWG